MVIKFISVQYSLQVRDYHSAAHRQWPGHQTHVPVLALNGTLKITQNKIFKEAHTKIKI